MLFPNAALMHSFRHIHWSHCRLCRPPEAVLGMAALVRAAQV